MLLKICDFTQTEADYLEAVCNFTEEENTLFQLRLKDIPLEKCAEIMSRGTDSIKKLSGKVIAKIKREV